jgi:hypothetical protein
MRDRRWWRWLSSVRGWIVGIGGVLLAGSGCSHMNQAQTGAAIGGALGTAAGLGVGAATGNPRTGALIGGLAGAGIGGLIGNEATKKNVGSRWNSNRPLSQREISPRDLV